MTTAQGADGTPLHVVESGRADAPVTVVLAHGWTLDERCWAPVAELLAAGDVRVVRYDHRGHGRSGAVDPATMTLDQLADDLAALIWQVAPRGPLVLAGHSMGGMTTMALAERHPDLARGRVAALALVATASGGLGGQTFGLPSPAFELVRAAEKKLYASKGWSTRRALSRHPTLLSPAMRWLLLGPAAGKQALRITTASVSQCRPLTVSGFRPTLEAHERDAALALYSQVPTHIMVGTRDRLTPPRYSRRIREGLPSAQLTVFPDAGHMLPVERTAGVAGRIAALARTAAGTRAGT
ncbi:alpha/beta fold hydrolase [Pseudonocardia sp. RS010]|uniref:alpha/beta fold hydrolase n=1 Tax=Pseudonocardia sp. RS010 TaxID=3385979 RepID=UPI0039A0EBF8